MSSPMRSRALSLSADKNKNKLKDLENYYKVLKQNVLDFQYEFTVNLKKKDKTRQLLFNLKENTIQIFKLKKKGNKRTKIKKYQLDDFERICKDRSDNKLLILTKKGGKKDILLSFINAERRESLYELLWLSRGGAVKGKAVPSKEERAPFDKISIFVTTWNVGDAMASPDQLQHWIPNNNQHDIYAIGVQECDYQPNNNNGGSSSGSSTPLSASSNSTPLSSSPVIGHKSHSRGGSHNGSTTPPLLSQNTSDNCADHWFQTLANHLGHNYFKLQSISLVKMRLVVFAKKEHYYKINHIERESEATGIGGIYGNKGATAISFKFLESSFLFISSHFAAHQEKVDQRNANYRDIIKGLGMGTKSTDVLNQFHHVFWMGDFNYRIDMFREEVLNAVSANNINKLIANDQLARQKLAEKVFVGFREPPITFMPTYKMERSLVGMYTAEKNRVPSYCDRILYKPLPYAPLMSCLSYSSAPLVTTSDHIPVYAVYETYVQRPCLPTQRPQSKCNIELFDVGALQLDVGDDGDAPNPFLVFHASSFLTEAVSTGHAKNTRCPMWGDVPPLTPVITKKSFLENQYLFITVFDDKESPPRKIGHATIPLALGYANEPYSFQTRLTKYGLATGILFGKVHIISEDPHHKDFINNSDINTNNTDSNNQNNNNNNNNSDQQQQTSPLPNIHKLVITQPVSIPPSPINIVNVQPPTHNYHQYNATSNTHVVSNIQLPPPPPLLIINDPNNKTKMIPINTYNNINSTSTTTTTTTITSDKQLHRRSTRKSI